MRYCRSYIAPETSGAKVKALEDNKGAMSLMQNPLSSARRKHMGVRYHFIRELLKSGRMTLEVVLIDKQHAVFLTKALSRPKVEYHRKAMMNVLQ